MSDDRSIEMEVEVVGTPEEVWRAIATGPGITSWYVPHVIEELEGGSATASFGLAPEMQIQGRVAVWEPPNRVVFDGGEGVDGLAFEWLVEAGAAGTCMVRLINSGFSVGVEGDEHFDAMTGGWPIFMLNLRLHLEHFPGGSAAASLPMSAWPAPRERTWSSLAKSLEIVAAPAVGDRLEVGASGAPPLGGVVVDVAPSRISLLVEQPAPGTAFIAAEGHGKRTAISIWSYLYGDEGAAAVARDEPLWQQWLNDRGAELTGEAASG